MNSFREFITESADSNELKQKLEKATGFKTMSSQSSFGTKIVFLGVDIPRKKMELDVGKNGDLRLWVPGFNFKTTENDEVKFFKELLKEVEQQQAKVQQRARTSKGAIKYEFEDDDHELEKLINIIDKILTNLK